MFNRNLLCVSVLLLVTGRAFGVVRVVVEAPNDDASVRQAVREAPELRESMLLLFLIEPLAIADRSRKSGLRFPFSYETLSHQELEKRLGAPIEWSSKRFARPCAGQDIIFPQGVKAEDADGILKHAKFYELKGVGGILVPFTSGNVAVAPAVVYLETSKGFVPLKGRDDLSKRLNWEGTKLRQLRKWLAIPEDVVKKDGEFVIALEGKDER